MPNLTDPMTPDERDTYQVIVGCMILAASLYWMFGGIWRSLIVFALTVTCGLAGLGTRWLMRAALTALAVAVMINYEMIDTPSHWASGLKSFANSFRPVSVAVEPAPVAEITTSGIGHRR
jgi:hypothetical protein